MIDFTQDDFNIFDYRLKMGDIKVNANELQRILFLLLKALFSDGNAYESFTEDELNFINIFINQHIILGSLRLNQKVWYDTLQKFNDTSFTKGKTTEEVDALRREVLAYYLDFKTKSELLTSEIKNIKDDS